MMPSQQEDIGEGNYTEIKILKLGRDILIINKRRRELIKHTRNW